MHQQSFVTRRGFLTHATALGVVALAGEPNRVLLREFTSSRDQHVRLDQLTAADFSRHVGNAFHLRKEDGRPLQAVLVEVRPSLSAPVSARSARQPFSLLFRLNGTERVSHQICQVEHVQMGRFDLFLGAVGQPTSNVMLEAIFG